MHKSRKDIDRYFTGRMFRRQYVPALISALVLSFGDVADSLVLGNRIGYIGLAALALTMPVSQVFNVIMNALGIGGSVRFASRMAQGRREEALAGFQGVVCAAAVSGAVIAVGGNLLLGLILRLLGTAPGDGELYEVARSYLRILLWGTPMLFLNYVLNYFMKTDDLEKQASAVFTVGNIADILLNVVLVLFLRMGAAGAALSTVMGQTVGTVSSVILIVRHKGVLKLWKLKPDLREAWRSFRMGFSSSVEFLYSMVFLLLANNLLIRIQGEAGVAILDVVLGVSYFMGNLYDAVAKSALPVVSTYCGERNEVGMRLGRNLGLLYTLISGAALGAAVFLFPEAICRFFGMTEPAMLASGRTALRLYGLGIPLAGVGILLTNYHEARQQPRETMVRSTLRGVLPILLAVLFAAIIPERFWALYAVSEALALILFSLLYQLHGRQETDDGRVFRQTIYSTGSEVSRVTEEIDSFCERWDALPAQQYMAMMSVEEICVATMTNGFRGKEDGFIQIVLVALEDGGFELHIRDNAASFNPLAMELTGNVGDDSANLDALGIMTVKKKAKSFSYRHFQGFNTVIIQI